MPLVTLTLAQILDLLATQFSASAAIPANTDAGSSLGAIFNADGLLMLFVQNELVYVDSISRLGTSQGADVDTFCAPFGIPRLGPSPSSGGVTCSTPSPVVGPDPLIVPVGGILVTASGLQFLIVADESNPDYSSGDAGYPIAEGDSSTIVSVVCTVAGTIGNVGPGQIDAVFGSTTSTPITGISTVSNADAFTNGIPQESDTDYKARFTLIVSSGRVATQNAILGAIASVQAGLTYSLGDRINPDGSTHYGFFSVIVNVRGQNEGPSDALISAVETAVESVRSAGISYVVQGPSLTTVNGAATIYIASGFVTETVIAAVQAAYVAYVNGIGLDPGGGPTLLSYGKTYAVLLAVPGVSDVDDLLLNGDDINITAPFAHQLVAGTAAFTPSS